MSANLRNKPVDKRYLRKEDRGAVSNRRAQALARTRARRGAAAYNYSRPTNTTKRYKGANAYAPGIRAQQMRMQEVSANKQRAENLRPESIKKPSPLV